MHSFEHDRDVIVSLPARYAKTVLGLMENKSMRVNTPIELRAALAAAQRCPDVARFFLVEKLRTQLDAQ